MSTVKKEIVLQASREKVWKFIATPEGLASWLMESDFSPEKDIEFTFRGEANEEWDGRIYCRILDIVPNERISFTWNANDIQGETVVVIELEQIEDDEACTRLRLIHSNFESAKLDTSPIVDRHKAGWDHHLAILQKTIQTT